MAELAPIPTRSVSLDSKAVRLAKRGTAEGSLFVSLAILTKWFSLTRLETRTKESNIYASIWVANPDA